LFLMRLLTLRASSAPIAFLCGASVQPSDLPINVLSEAADVGTAAHEALRSLAETGRLDWDAIPMIAKRHGVPEDDVRILCAQANKLWPQLADTFQGALTEVELSAVIADGFTLTGHADLLTITGTVARGGDWKTGRKDSSHEQQLRAYCALVMLENPELTEVTFTAIWVRDSEIENYTMSRAGCLSWLAELMQSVVHWDGVYRTGPHCGHCPRNHECPAVLAHIRRDVAAIADRDLLGRVECEIEKMSAAEIVAVLQKADLVTKFAERTREAIKKHVIAHGDIVADGVRLTIATEQRRELDPLAAWPVLEQTGGFTDEDFAQVIDLKPSRVEKQVASKAPRGKGAAAVREIQSALEAAGAVGVKEVQKLTQKRA
jgi:hypothetical protein